jgi:Zn-finger nucleic acid-binding protein
MSAKLLGLNCPACNVALVMSERQGIEIDYCPQCRGVWLDRGELDKITEPAARPAPQQAEGRQDYRRGHDDDYRGERYPKRKKSFLEELFD